MKILHFIPICNGSARFGINNFQILLTDKKIYAIDLGSNHNIAIGEIGAGLLGPIGNFASKLISDKLDSNSKDKGIKVLQENLTEDYLDEEIAKSKYSWSTEYKSIFSFKFKIGTMIEIPSAIIGLSKKELKFINFNNDSDRAAVLHIIEEKAPNLTIKRLTSWGFSKIYRK